MAVVVTKNLGVLKLHLDKGLDANSKAVKGTKSFNYVNTEISNNDLYAVATALGDLQKHDVYNVTRLNSSTLSE